MRQVAIALCCGLALAVLVACATPDATPERLSTRAYTPVPTPYLTATPTPFSISPWTYLQDGQTRHATGDLEGALRSFGGAVRLNPDFALAYVARGKVYLAQGNPRQALADAETALRIAPSAVEAHVLQGEALRQLRRYRAALEALDKAVALAPRLKSATFQSRWLAARAAEDSQRLAVLGQEYADAHPEDSLRYYYQGWGLIAANEPQAAVKVLIEGIESGANAPALLWFALSEAYLAEQAAVHAVTAGEAVRALFEAGDTSLSVHSDQPVAALFDLLGRAYLAAGRCVDAETMLAYARSVETSKLVADMVLEQARLCLTPTPTPTPYPTTTPSRS